MNVQCSHTLQTQTHNKHVPEHQLKQLQGKAWPRLGPETTTAVPGFRGTWSVDSLKCSKSRECSISNFDLEHFKL